MGFRITRQDFAKATCDGEQLTKSFLYHLNAKMETDIPGVLNERYEVKLNVSQLFILPSFNQFLEGRSINER